MCKKIALERARINGTVELEAETDELPMLLSWVLMGRVWPVIVSPMEKNSFYGKPCKAGYDSHYVVVNDRKLPCAIEEQPLYDELVAFDPDQVLPRYIVYYRRAYSERSFDAAASSASESLREAVSNTRQEPEMPQTSTVPVITSHSTATTTAPTTTTRSIPTSSVDHTPAANDKASIIPTTSRCEPTPPSTDSHSSTASTSQPSTDYCALDQSSACEAQQVPSAVVGSSAQKMRKIILWLDPHESIPSYAPLIRQYDPQVCTM
jgi:hypothetical protein